MFNTLIELVVTEENIYIAILRTVKVTCYVDKINEFKGQHLEISTNRTEPTKNTS